MASSSKQSIPPSTLPTVDLQHLRVAVVRSTTYEDYATYDIQVTCQDMTWTVSKRFSEFQEVHDALAQYCTSLPLLPEKTFLRSLEPDFIENRRVRLNVYMQALVALPYARNSRVLLNFLDVYKHLRPDTSMLPRVYQTISDRNYGTNDVYYSAEDGFLLAACEDVAVLAKIESKLGYLGSFFSSLAQSASGSTSSAQDQVHPVTLELPGVTSVVDPTDPNVPISGLIMAWTSNPARDTWMHVCTVCFSSPAVHVVWDRKRRHAYVGLENGHIVVLAANENLKSLVPLREIVLHSDRFAGLIYMADRDMLLAASRDKRVSVYSLAENKLIGRSLINEPKFASLALDPVSGLVYVGAFDSALYVYELHLDGPSSSATSTSSTTTVRSLDDLSTLPVASIRKYSNLHRGCIRALAIDVDNSSAAGPKALLMTGSFDYSSLLIELPTNQSQLSRQPPIRMTFQGGVPSSIKAVALCLPANVVVTGHDDGSVMTWDLTTGRPLFHSLAHSNSVVYLKYLPESNSIISAGRDGKIHFWLLSARVPQRRSVTSQVPVVGITSGISASLLGNESKTPSPSWSLQSESKQSPESTATRVTGSSNPSATAKVRGVTGATTTSATTTAPSDDGLVDLRLNDDEFADLGMKLVDE